MTTFRFRAQAALDLRKRQAEEAEQALALAEASVEDARGTLRTAERRLDDMLHQATAETAAGDLAAGAWYTNWLVGQRRQIERCREAVVEAQAFADRARHQARLARRKAKSLERLRDHAWQSFVRDGARAEQKVIDDIGTLRFTRGRPHAGVERRS